MASDQNLKEEVASRLVQEISRKQEGFPELRHIIITDHQGIISPAIDAPPELWQDTLLIDYSLLCSNSSSFAHQNELSKLHFALKHWGCFQVINHCMTNLFLDELLDVSKQFFGLPLEEKLKCCEIDDHYNGYGNASDKRRDTALNWSDRLFLTLHPEDQRNLQVWPEKPHKLREILHEYTLRIKMMMEVILKSMARSLNIKEDGLMKKHGERGTISTRIGIYPRCSCPEQVYGVSPHSDRSTLTFVLQDKDVPEGLHILKDDQWFKVPVIPCALFVNLGDFAEVMSNGIYKSVLHRVMTNSVKDRVSIAGFCGPNPENDLEPIPELINNDHPIMYKKVTMKAYKQLYFENYPQCKKVVDALKI